MDTLSSSFLPRNRVPLINASSFKINLKRSQYMNIKAESSFTIYQQPSKTPKINHSKPSLSATIFNTLDDFICRFIDSPLPSTLEPKQVLSGNFAPVDELPPTACQVAEGSLPACLDGAYIRIGPNPQFIPKGPYHFFDGDGMLQMIRISHGKATFCCRYVNTHKHVVEREIGYPFVPSILSSFNGGLVATISRSLLTMARVLAKQFDPLNHGFGAANTNLSVFSGHIYALCESDLPYAVKVTPEEDIETLGRHDFAASEPFVRMTAHPKIDRVTGEAFAYSYNSKRPFLTLFRIDPDGIKQKDVAIYSMEGTTAMHDFAVTEKYCVIPDIQIVVNPLRILVGRSPVETDASKVARLGIIPKYAEDEKEMVWIDAPDVNLLHCVNAWEEDGGGKIVIVASNVLQADKWVENLGVADLKMEKITINVKEKTVQRIPLSPQFLELGVINPSYATKKNRYVYSAIIGRTRLLGVVKLDLLLSSEAGGDCTVASRLYGPGCHGGEPFFVAREPDNPMAEEDDGYLVLYLYDENTQESKFLVMDAKSPNLDIIAAVKLPQRTPNGFHGLFVSENDLKHLCNN